MEWSEYDEAGWLKWMASVVLTLNASGCKVFVIILTYLTTKTNQLCDFWKLLSWYWIIQIVKH